MEARAQIREHRLERAGREWLVDRIESLEDEVRRLREALEAGRRFERAYQESLGATPTPTQHEILDRLQGRFLDLYCAALAHPDTAEGAEGDE